MVNFLVTLCAMPYGIIISDAKPPERVTDVISEVLYILRLQSGVHPDAGYISRLNIQRLRVEALNACLKS